MFRNHQNAKTKDTKLNSEKTLPCLKIIEKKSPKQRT
ncbi:unnamed protein product [Larinioides sclopetarius]|uniref:Ribosomal protein L33 n=1 Tax=Larinioides sclopetarius TaxID=280406 RepID=A0AAV1Z909_9ARAC